MVKCKTVWQVASDKWQVSGRKAPIIMRNAKCEIRNEIAKRKLSIIATQFRNHFFTIHFYFLTKYAGVAELADALDSGSSECKFM